MCPGAKEEKALGIWEVSVLVAVLEHPENFLGLTHCREPRSRLASACLSTFTLGPTSSALSQTGGAFSVSSQSSLLWRPAQI